MTSRRLFTLPRAAALVGLALLAWPLVAAPTLVLVMFAVGVLALGVGTATSRAGSRTFVVVLAIAETAIVVVARPRGWGPVDTGVEALLLLAYLILVDLPGCRASAAIGRRQVRELLVSVAGAVAVTVAVLAVAQLRPPATVWLVLAGMVAAIAALLLARPSRAPSGDRSSERPT